MLEGFRSDCEYLTVNGTLELHQLAFCLCYASYFRDCTHILQPLYKYYPCMRLFKAHILKHVVSAGSVVYVETMLHSQGNIVAGHPKFNEIKH